jgi:hypothetical protein
VPAKVEWPIVTIDRLTRALRLMDELEGMAAHGQSVTLNWGEDNGLWECSWITGDRRYTAFSKNVDVAVRLVTDKVVQ